MSDAPNVASVAGGEANAAPATPNAGTASPAPEIEKKPPATDAGGAALESLAGDEDGEQTPAAPQNFPDNWREILAKDDANALAYLKRFGSVDGLYKKLQNQEKLIKTTRAVPELTEDATPEEVAAHRKALGIPEKPEDYGLKFADEVKPNEADVALLQDFMKDMHGKNMTPVTVKGMFDWYQSRLVAVRESQAEALREAEVETRNALRQEFGRELKYNLAFVDKFLEDEGLSPLLGAILPNGRPVSRDADMLKRLIEFTRSVAPDGATVGGDVAGGGQSADDRAKELRAKSIAGTISKAEDAELNKYYERRAAAEERQGRRQATSAAA